MIDYIVFLWELVSRVFEMGAGNALEQHAVAPMVAAAAISAAASLGNAIFGSASAAKQRREQQRAIEKEKAEQRAFFQRYYNEDATQRASNQRLLTRANEMNKKRSLAAAGKRAVIGGTDASQAATQQANAEAMGNAVSTIAARADDKKDALAQQHRSTMSGLNRQSAEIDAQAEAAKRNATAQAATTAANTAAAIIAAGGEGSASAPKAATPPIAPTQAEIQAQQNANLAAMKKAVEPQKPKAFVDTKGREGYGKWYQDTVDLLYN